MPDKKGERNTDLALETRQSLPEEIAFMLADFPRDIWRHHENMGQLLRFWLSRHSQFRSLSTKLNERNHALLEGTITLEVFARDMVPGFNMLLGALEEHHNVEDHHYFPKFLAAESRLKRGFDVLDKDHHALHEAMAQVAATANEFMKSGNRDDLLKSGESFVAANERLLAFINRHLEDEEDLIVPLLLDRGEDAFH